MENTWFVWNSNPDFNDMLSRPIVNDFDFRKKNKQYEEKRIRARKKRLLRNKIKKRK